MVNKRGQVGIAIIAALVVFIVGIMCVNFIMPEVTTFRSDLNCANATAISDGTKLTCLAGGVAVPYFIILVLSVAVGVVADRFAIS
jgi:hypothetical protein